MLLTDNSARIIIQFVESCFREDELNSLSLFDNELDGQASDCSTLQIAAFLANMHSRGLTPLGDINSRRLVQEILRRRDSPEWFSIPYNAPVGANGLVDLAEFGASAISALYFSEHVDTGLGVELLESMANRIETHEHPGKIGAYHKNASATAFDVLNGDLYAALVSGAAYQASKNPRYHHQMTASVRHLISRFDYLNCQWPYSETWDGEPHIGMSVAYQATITGWGRKLVPLMPGLLAKQWCSTLDFAQAEVMRQISSGRSLKNEATTWVSPWERVWEMWLSMLGDGHSKVKSLWLTERIDELNTSLEDLGIDYFRDSRETRPNRTVIGSRLRSLSNVVAILQIADEQDQLVFSEAR